MRVLDDEVFAAERAYVAAAGGIALPAIARAVAGAVASRYLAVSTPRSLAIIGDRGDGADSLAAHRVWFAPRDVRCTLASVAEATGGRVVTLDEALGADIVCIHEPTVIGALRRGTHVNALAAGVTWPADLAAVIVRDLAPIAAGILDGRAMDEITIFVLG